MHQDLGKSPRKFPASLLPALGYMLLAQSHLGFSLVLLPTDFGWRWNTLLGPVARHSYWRSVQAIYIGLHANEVLALRNGEVIRCYLQAYWSSFPISLALYSVAVESRRAS